MNEHKEIYGETLRSELVYRFNQQLKLNSRFKIDKDYQYILIDEYQDLNACDLSIIDLLKQKGVELFVTGDDDQSIYGFRYASPEGIRNFIREYNATELALETCYRCDKKIIEFAEFVANQDLERIPKTVNSYEDAGSGEVEIYRCQDQVKEASLVADKISNFIREGIEPGKIAILFRSDRNKIISPPITAALEKKSIKMSFPVMFNKNDIFQKIISYLQILFDREDSLG